MMKKTGDDVNLKPTATSRRSHIMTSDYNLQRPSTNNSQSTASSSSSAAAIHPVTPISSPFADVMGLENPDDASREQVSRHTVENEEQARKPRTSRASRGDVIPIKSPNHPPNRNTPSNGDLESKEGVGGSGFLRTASNYIGLISGSYAVQAINKERYEKQTSEGLQKSRSNDFREAREPLPVRYQRPRKNLVAVIDRSDYDALREECDGLRKTHIAQLQHLRREQERQQRQYTTLMQSYQELDEKYQILATKYEKDKKLLESRSAELRSAEKLLRKYDHMPGDDILFERLKDVTTELRALKLFVLEKNLELPEHPGSQSDSETSSLRSLCP